MAFKTVISHYPRGERVPVVLKETITATLFDAIDVVNCYEAHVFADIYENDIHVLMMRTELGEGRSWYTV